jgi:WD domain, G-beta repeat
MRQLMAARLSRALVACYPPRWKQRYREEILDVLDQHRARPRTVLSLASGAMTAHLDPSYRMEKPVIRIKNDVTQGILMFAGGTALVVVLLFGLFFLVNLPGIIKDSSWRPGHAGGDTALQLTPNQRLLATVAGGEPTTAVVTLWSVGGTGVRQLSSFEGGMTVAIAPDSRMVATSAFGGQAALWNVTRPTHPALLSVLYAGASNALWGEAFSPDSRLLAAAYGGGVALWDVVRPARPRLLTVLDAHVGPVTHADIAFSPDGHLLVLASGNSQATIWNVARPAHAEPVATVTGRGGYFQALTFSPSGGLLAGVTTGGTVLVYRLDGRDRPVLTAIRSGLAAQALYPGAQHAPAGLAAGCPGCMVPSYALGFAPGGTGLTVVLDKIFPDNSSRDTAFTWQVTASGGLAGGTSSARDTWDGQPALASDGRTIVDGSAFGRNAVGMWELPPAPVPVRYG